MLRERGKKTNLSGEFIYYINYATFALNVINKNVYAISQTLHLTPVP